MSSNPSDEEIEAWQLAQIKQHRSYLQAKPIKTVINKLLAQHGYAAVQAAAVLQSQWSEVVGEVLSARTRLGNISRGTLLVEVADSGSLQELHFRKRQILAEMQRRLPDAKITDLRMRVSNFS